MSKYPFKLGPSKIHGTGVFATRLIKAGEMISTNCPVFYSPKFRGFNHCCVSNVGDRIPGSMDDNYHWKRPVLRDIQEGEEITLNYGKVRTDNRTRFECNCEVCRNPE